MTTNLSIAEILAGVAAPGQAARVRGWVRTRRDSKAGLSFLHVHDGSGFEPLQVVAPAELANYADILQVTTGQDPVKTAQGAYEMAKKVKDGGTVDPHAVELPGIVYDRADTATIEAFLASAK